MLSYCPLSRIHALYHPSAIIFISYAISNQASNLASHHTVAMKCARALHFPELKARALPLWPRRSERMLTDRFSVPAVVADFYHTCAGKLPTLELARKRRPNGDSGGCIRYYRKMRIASFLIGWKVLTVEVNCSIIIGRLLKEGSFDGFFRVV